MQLAQMFSKQGCRLSSSEHSHQTHPNAKTSQYSRSISTKQGLFDKNLSQGSPQKNNTIPRFCAVSLHPSLSRGSTSPSCCTVSPRVKVQQLKSRCLRQFINLVKRFSTCLTRLGGTDFGRILKQL